MDFGGSQGATRSDTSGIARRCNAGSRQTTRPTAMRLRRHDTRLGALRECKPAATPIPAHSHPGAAWASAAHLVAQRRPVSLATYDRRMQDAAAAMQIPVVAL